MHFLSAIPIEKERLIHSIKTVLACLIGFAVGKIVHFQVDQWLMITILVVMCAQLNVGSMLQKSYMRFLGTLFGTLSALFILFFFPNNVFANFMMVCIGALVFSYIATGKQSYSEAGTLGAVTIAIILIGKYSDITIAFERFMEISLGILIATLVSQFILPSHASIHLRQMQAGTLKQLRDYYRAALMTKKSNDTSVIYYEVDEALAKSLISQRKLAAEAAREHLGDKFNAAHFSKALWCEKEIFRNINFLQYAYNQSLALKKLFIDAPEIKQFNEDVCQLLTMVAKKIENPRQKNVNFYTKYAKIKSQHSADDGIC